MLPICLNLRGWVRNRGDSSVEILVSGGEAAVNKLITAAHTGPPHAQVEEVSFSAVDGRDPDLAMLPSGFQQADSVK